MKSDDDIICKVNNCIQKRLSEPENGKGVDAVTATKWLIEEKLREKMDKRPGSYLRGKCRTGKILGAEKKGKNWIIKRMNL
jgi:hypothetical protein